MADLFPVTGVPQANSAVDDTPGWKVPHRGRPHIRCIRGHAAGWRACGRRQARNLCWRR